MQIRFGDDATGVSNLGWLYKKQMKKLKAPEVPKIVLYMQEIYNMLGAGLIHSDNLKDANETNFDILVKIGWKYGFILDKTIYFMHVFDVTFVIKIDFFSKGIIQALSYQGPVVQSIVSWCFTTLIPNILIFVV